MARRITIGCALAAFALVTAAGPAVPPLTGRIVDRAGMLPGSDAARVEQAILDLEQATGGQMAVLTMPSLNGDSLEEFCMRVATQWQIGHQGRDDGAILVLVRDTREIRLEIGRGWEGSVTDARAGVIIRGLMPYFRAGRFGDGAIYAVRHVQGFVTGSTPTGLPALPPPGSAEGSSAPGNVRYIQIGSLRIHPAMLFLAFGVLFLVVIVLSVRRQKRTGGGYSGRYGGWSGGGSSRGGGFRGGGGRFSGGGASGRW